MSERIYRDRTGRCAEHQADICEACPGDTQATEAERWKALAGRQQGALRSLLDALGKVQDWSGTRVGAGIDALESLLADPDGTAALAEWTALREEVAEQQARIEELEVLEHEEIARDLAERDMEAAQEEAKKLRAQLADAHQARDRADLVARQADEMARMTEARLAEAGAALAAAGRALEASLRLCECRGRQSYLVPGAAGTWVDAPCGCVALSIALSAPALARATALDRARREVVELGAEVERVYLDDNCTCQHAAGERYTCPGCEFSRALSRLRSLEAQPGGEPGGEG